MKYEKPPIGIMPKWLWEEQRLHDLHSAIQRYLDVGMTVNPEWIEEYNELSKRIRERKETK